MTLFPSVSKPLICSMVLACSHFHAGIGKVARPNYKFSAARDERIGKTKSAIPHFLMSQVSRPHSRDRWSVSFRKRAGHWRGLTKFREAWSAVTSNNFAVDALPHAGQVLPDRER